MAFPFCMEAQNVMIKELEQERTGWIWILVFLLSKMMLLFIMP